MKRILNRSFPRVIAGSLTLALLAPNSALALRLMGVEDGQTLRKIRAGMEEEEEIAALDLSPTAQIQRPDLYERWVMLSGIGMAQAIGRFHTEVPNSDRQRAQDFSVILSELATNVFHHVQSRWFSTVQLTVSLQAGVSPDVPQWIVIRYMDEAPDFWKIPIGDAILVLGKSSRTAEGVGRGLKAIHRRATKAVEGEMEVEGTESDGRRVRYRYVHGEAERPSLMEPEATTGTRIVVRYPIRVSATLREVAASIQQEFAAIHSAGLEEPTEAEVQGVLQALLGVEGGSDEIWSSIVRIREWYRNPRVKYWQTVSVQAPDLLAALLFHTAPGGPQVSEDAWLALKEMMGNGVSPEVLGLPRLPSRTELKWLTEVVRVVQKNRPYWELSFPAMTALIRGALQQILRSPEYDPPLRGSREDVVQELAARVIESALFEAGLDPKDEAGLHAILGRLRPDIANGIKPFLAVSAAGLEQKEKQLEIDLSV